MKRAIVVTIIKNEADYIEEWVAFHIAAGFDHFVLYDNNSDDGTRDVLSKYLQSGRVTLIDWPKPFGQLSAYLHAVNMFWREDLWMAFIDADEFVVLRRHDSIGAFLDGVSAAQILMPWRVFGPSGHRTAPEGLVSETFTMSQSFDLVVQSPVHTKSLVRSDRVKFIGIHKCLVTEGTTLDWTLTPVDPNVRHRYDGQGDVQLNHYYYKSYDEYSRKIARGSATGALIKRQIAFDKLEQIYTVPDTTIARWHAPTRQVLRRYARMPDNPFRYGVEFAARSNGPRGNVPYMTDTVRYDPFGWYTRRAVSDFVDGKRTITSYFRRFETDGTSNHYSLNLDVPAPNLESEPGDLHFGNLAKLFAAEVFERPAVPDGAALRLELAEYGATQDLTFALIAFVTCEDGTAEQATLVIDTPEGENLRPVRLFEGATAIVHELNPDPGPLEAVTLTLPGARLSGVLLYGYG